MKKNIAIAPVSLLLAGFLCGCITSDRKTDATPEATVESQSGAVDERSGPESGDAPYEVLDGWLALDLDQQPVTDRLGQPENKGKDEYWGALGAYVQQWEYPSKGIVLEMVSDEAGGNKAVLTIRIASPARLKTAKGVGIGADKKTVMEAYGKTISREFTNDEQIVVGSIYDGVIFTIKDNKVASIFIGAAAE